MVMVVTVVVSVMGGLAFRRKFPGSNVLFYLIITSLVIPSILISLGVGLLFSQSGLNVHWSTSGFGAQLTWTLPFGLLIMFAVFNRFDKSYAGSYNTLPLEIYGMTTNVTSPVLYALGTLTTVFSLVIIGIFLCVALVMNRRRAQQGSDAGKGV